MVTWTPSPGAGRFAFDAAQVRSLWSHLHCGDAEPLPTDDAVLQAWVQYHNGQFQEAAEIGLATGGGGITVANKATAVYAFYVEQKEGTRLALFTQVAERAQAQAAASPDNPNAWYCYAYAMGGYSQSISVAKALAKGLGNKVRESLERTIELCPAHADAYMALGVFHAEVIDKVGALIGGMTYGVRKDESLALLHKSLRLQPQSPVALIQLARATLMLEGQRKLADANALYQQAAECAPLDAVQYLHVSAARAEIDNDAASR